MDPSSLFIMFVGAASRGIVECGISVNLSLSFSFPSHILLMCVCLVLLLIYLDKIQVLESVDCIRHSCSLKAQFLKLKPFSILLFLFMYTYVCHALLLFHRQNFGCQTNRDYIICCHFSLCLVIFGVYQTDAIAQDATAKGSISNIDALNIRLENQV